MRKNDNGRPPLWGDRPKATLLRLLEWKKELGLTADYLEVQLAAGLLTPTP
jgi:hypothetical protein